MRSDHTFVQWNYHFRSIDEMAFNHSQHSVCFPHGLKYIASHTLDPR